MRRVAGRLLLAVALAGQLQLIPAAVACVREHRQPAAAAHCADAAADVAGASVRPIHDASPLCALLGPCAVPGAAVVARLTPADFRFAEERSGAPGQPSRPASFDLTPPAPPPEA